jgi:two-component system NarL family sensor kinase
VLLAWAWHGTTLGKPRGFVLLLDALTLTGLLAISATLAAPGSGPLVDDAFFFIAVLAAFQLRPAATAAAATVVAATYYTTAVGTTDFHWTRALVHALFLTTIGAGCALLSWSHRLQLELVATLADHRAQLVSQVMHTEQREREALATFLHDTALQSVLAARQDVEDAQSGSDPDALARAHTTLTEATRQLRAGVTELHPEVLKHGGLVKALHTLRAQGERRARVTIEVDTCAYVSDQYDALLYTVARELLTNAIKHAQAQRITLRLSQNSDGTQLEVTDNGVGVTRHAMMHAVEQGHIGLASHRIRVEAVGGRFDIGPNTSAGSGTRALVTIPGQQTIPGLSAVRA